MSPNSSKRFSSINELTSELAFSMVQMYTAFLRRRLRGGIWPLAPAYSSTAKSSSAANGVRDLTWKEWWTLGSCLVHERHNSIANALELRLFCTNPSRCTCLDLKCAHFCYKMVHCGNMFDALWDLWARSFENFVTRGQYFDLTSKTMS